MYSDSKDLDMTNLYSLETSVSSWQDDLSFNLSSSDSIESDLTYTNERSKSSASKADRIETNIKDIESILSDKKRIVSGMKNQTREDDRIFIGKLTDIENQIEICRLNLRQLLDEIHHLNVLKEAEIKMKEEEVYVQKQTLLSTKNCARCKLCADKTSNNKKEKDLSNADAELNNRNQYNQEIRQASRSPKRVEKRKPVSWTVPISLSKTPHSTDIELQINTHTESKGKELTLRQAFESKCPHLLQRFDYRASKINAKFEIRRRTANIRRQRAIHEYTLTKQIEEEQRRRKAMIRFVEPRKIFTEKEMRSQTARRYCSLPEIELRKELQKKEDEARKHRMISRIFSQKLKSQALRGQVSLPFTEKMSC